MRWDLEAFRNMWWKLGLVFVSEIVVDVIKHSFMMR